MKSTIIFFAIFAAAHACTCVKPPTLENSVLDAKNTKAPFAVATVVSKDRPNDPSGFEDITFSVRPEGCNKTVKLTTAATRSLCGVQLRLNTKYVLKLNKNGSPTPIGRCDTFEKYDSLSAADKVFVALNVPGRCEECREECPPNTFCRDGECMKIPTCLALCPEPFICQFGGCVSKCLTTICAPGFVCRQTSTGVECVKPFA